MKSRLPMYFAAAIMLLLVCVIIVQKRDIDRLRHSLQALDDIAYLRKKSWSDEKKIDQLQAQIAQLNPRVPGMAELQKSVGANTLAEMAASWMAIAGRPEVMENIRAVERARVDVNYGELLQSLHLDATKQEKLKDLLTERRAVANDVLISALDNGVNPLQNPAEFAKLASQAQSQVDGEIRNTIGSEAYDTYKRYESEQGSRGIVKQLDDATRYTESPLSPEQRSKVSDLLGEANSQKAPGDANVGLDDAVIAKAAGFLKPVQLKAFEDIQKAANATVHLRQLRNGAKGNK